MSKRQKSPVVRVYNCSKQMIALQMRVPGSDFYSNEQQVRLAPGQEALLPKHHLREDQVKNLQVRRMIKIVHDSERNEKRQEALIS